MKEAVENIILKLVDSTESVSVEEFDEGKSSVIEVRVAEGDIGRVIGKGGRTIKAIRSLLFFSGQKHKKRFNLQMIED
ncbi:MAG: KH domain-containing protein [Pyrinomonadaceae bacterium]